MPKSRTDLISSLLICAALDLVGSPARADAPAGAQTPVGVAPSERAVLWVQTAAEYRILARSAYAGAARMLKDALEQPSWTAALEQVSDYQQLPPALILDIDETVLDNTPFQASVVQAVQRGAADAYYPEAWDLWVSLERAPAVPGAAELVWTARRLGVEVFYVTNRECKRREEGGPICPQEAETLENLRNAGFPPSDGAHMLLKGEEPDWTSEKSARRGLIAQRHRILLLIGDDLGDFVPGARSMSLAERSAQAEAAADWWGSRWFMLPNPVYGSWTKPLGDAPLTYLTPAPEILDAIAQAAIPVEKRAERGPVRIATWNMNNLYQIVGEPLREGAPVRNEADYATLRRYAERLAADVVALQEVAGPPAAARVFPAETYELYFSGRYEQDLASGLPSDRIYTGFAVRRGVFDSVVKTDYDALSVSVPGEDRPTRWGTDLVVTQGGKQLRLLAVHLKSGCSKGNLETPRTNECKALALQLPPLEAWIDQRAREAVPFVVLGDFNRAFDAYGARDHLWKEIDDGNPAPLDLFRLPEGQASECWRGTPLHHSDPIDFLVFDEQAFALVEPESFTQLTYDAADLDPARKTPSDHCPIAVSLRF